jgi:hypothetical protein
VKKHQEKCEKSFKQGIINMSKVDLGGAVSRWLGSLDAMMVLVWLPCSEVLPMWWCRLI